MKLTRCVVFFIITYFFLNQISLAQSVYVTSPYKNIVYVCDVSAQGPIQNCKATGNNFDNPTYVSLHPSNNLAYIANAASPPIIPLPQEPPPAGSVSYCSINTDSTLSNCKNAGGVFSGPTSVQFNSAGTIAYIVSHYYQRKITRCSVNTDGTFTACADMKVTEEYYKFGYPWDMALNSANNMAYITSGIDWTTYSCPINADNTFGDCTKLYNWDMFKNPFSIILTNNETNAYITSTLSNSAQTILSCSINSQKSLGECKVANNKINFKYGSQLTLNPVNNFLYVSYLWGISYCTISSDKSLGVCKDAVPAGTTEFAYSKLTFKS